MRARMPPKKKNANQKLQTRNAKKGAKSCGPVPEGYVCRICNVPGHWIQACTRLV